MPAGFRQKPICSGRPPRMPFIHILTPFAQRHAPKGAHQADDRQQRHGHNNQQPLPPGAAAARRRRAACAAALRRRGRRSGRRAGRGRAAWDRCGRAWRPPRALHADSPARLVAPVPALLLVGVASSPQHAINAGEHACYQPCIGGPGSWASCRRPRCERNPTPHAGWAARPSAALRAGWPPRTALAAADRVWARGS